MTQELLTTLAAGCFLSFGFAARPQTSRVIPVVQILTAAIQVWAIWTGLSWFGAWALIPLAASWGLFWWTMDAIARQNIAGKEFAEYGPYKWIRHPLYLSYLLVWIAGPVAAGSPLPLVTAVMWAAFYTREALREENVLLAGPSGENYSTYRRRTGLFLPRLSPFVDPRSEEQRRNGTVPDLSPCELPAP
jgi:protein-S-isoprenylcysteine O-methyltransferase Ste14